MKKEPKPLPKRYLIKDANDKSETYQKCVAKHEANGVGFLVLSGVTGKHPERMTKEELLKSFQNLKIHYCMREMDYQKTAAELKMYKDAQKGRTGILKEFGAKDLDAIVFIRLVALRFNELSDEELEPLVRRKPDFKNYKVKRLSKTEFQAHLKKATDLPFGINYPYQRSRNYIFALKVMTIGVLEDYLGKELSPLQRSRIIDELDVRLKKLIKVINLSD